jgi:hypothetical protein
MKRAWISSQFQYIETDLFPVDISNRLPQTMCQEALAYGYVTEYYQIIIIDLTSKRYTEYSHWQVSIWRRFNIYSLVYRSLCMTKSILFYYNFLIVFLPIFYWIVRNFHSFISIRFYKLENCLYFHYITVFSMLFIFWLYKCYFP